MEGLSHSILRFRWLIIIIVTLLTAFLGYQISNIQINSDVISSLPEDDPDASLFRQIGQKYGGNKIGMVILEADDIFTNDVLKHVNALTDSLSYIDGIISVTSITNIIDIKGNEFGFEVGQLIDVYDLPLGPDELVQLRDRVLSKDMYRGSIVSQDGTATLVMFTVSDDSDIQTVGRKVISTAESLNLPETVYYAGLPMMVTSIANLIATDLIMLLPIAFLVIALVLFISFRTFRGVILPLFTAGLAIVWTLGIMAVLDFEMSMVTNNIPIILLAIGSAYSIHVINKINQVKEKDYRKAIVIALTYLFIPVFLASITTVVGFTSFVFEAYLTMIKDFGIFTALGTFLSALLALFFAPALLYIISPGRIKKKDYDANLRRSRLSENFLIPLQNLLFKHPRYTLVTWTVLVVLSAGAIFLIERNVDIKDYFRQDNPARLAENIMNEKFGGSKPIFIVFKGNVLSPKVLNAMIETEEFIKKDDNVLTAQSVADLIVDMNDVLGEGRKIPDEQDKIEQLWFFLDGNEYLQRFITEDLDEGIIISKYASSDNIERQDFVNKLNSFITEHSCEDCEIQLTGMPFIDLKMNSSLLSSQIRSLTIAIIALIIVVGIILRSFMTGVYATAPIIAAIVVLFGIMGITGIPLNIATVLVASVALGIGIDYSIHVISHFRHSLKNGKSLKDALEETIMISGKAIVINVISVTAGFLVLVFSEMVPLQYFGILMAISMVGSGLAALTLLPVILVLANRNKVSQFKE